MALPRAAASPTPLAGQREPTATSRADATVRVRSARLDALVGLVAEARRAAAVIAIGAGDARALADVLAEAEGAALRLRLVPLEGIFDGLRRAVRDAATADGKQAELHATGGEVEADAAVVDTAAEIVLQLVRNAVAHGVEPTAERRRVGKPEVGLIEVAVQARGGWLELTVQDDGRGVDEDALRPRARERGLDPSAPAAELLFAPGLSTRAQVDGLGGQGVGLDVVRARTAAAGGIVAVEWQPGLGTRFTVRLPVSALYERLLVGPLGDALVGIPADAVAAVGDEGDLALEGLPEEVNVLTVPLGPLFASSRLARRAWIHPDGRVGVVLDPTAAQAGRSTDGASASGGGAAFRK